MDLKGLFTNVARTLEEWRFPGGLDTVMPLGDFDVVSGTVLVSTQVHKSCKKCSDSMPIAICNACGKNSGNSVKINSGLGNGNFGLWGLGQRQQMPENPFYTYLPFDECLDPRNEQIFKNLWQTPYVPIVVAKFDADSFYRNHPWIFVGDKDFGIDGERFFSGARIPLGMTMDSLAPNADASMYVIAWVGYLHDPSAHFFMNQANLPGGYSISNPSEQSGELGIVACHMVPEELLAEFLPLYNAAKPQLSAFADLATSPREFALVGGAYVAGPNSSKMLSQMTTKDSRPEVADVNKQLWSEHPRLWFVGESWQYQLESNASAERLIDSWFETARRVGGAGDLIARADSLRLRGQVAASQAAVKRIEKEYVSSMDDQNRMMIRAMAATPAGHPIGMWSFN